MFFTVVLHCAIAIGVADFSRINVHTILSLFGEDHGQSDEISLDSMTDIFTQFFLFSPILMQSGHEIR